MSTHSPDKWVIVKIETKDKDDLYKVLGGWSGGYLDSDSWRMSSDLEKIEEEGDYYLMHNYSGSIYKCHKEGNGLTALSGSIYSQLEGLEDKEISLVSVEEFNER